MQTIIVRPLAAEDSLVELTTLLHRAFARLKRMGLACRSADQPVAVTRQRIGQGECFVAVCGGRIVGMDLVEVAPPYDPTGTTSILAAQLLLNSIGFIFHARQKAQR